MSPDVMEIEELRSYTHGQFEDIKYLMSQLSARCVFTETQLSATLNDSNCRMYVIFADGHIIACATLCVFHSPTGTKASVEDVVVASEYRGQQLGRQLIEHVLAEAEKLAPIELHLTSNPKRVVANGLYQSLGFKKKETNSYRMILPAKDT